MNMEIWNKVSKTPTEHTKAITGKSYSGTSPKPYYLIQKATEVFGPCGIGWGFTVLDERIEEGAGGERLSIARVKVWYEWNGKRGEVEHIGGTQFSGTRKSGQAFTDEDAPKKSVTDALVKALSMIGFAGDIFMGRYDDSKYVSELKAEEREAKSQPAPPRQDNAPKPAATSAKAIAAYVETFKFALGRCDYPSEVLTLWAEQAEERKKLGITPDSEAGQTLIGLRKDRIEELGMQNEAAQVAGVP